MTRTWPTAALDQVCECVTDGTHHSPKNLASGAYRYVTAKNIRPWGLDLSDITYVDEKTHREIYARCPVELGDILYIKDGVTTGLAVVNPLTDPFSMLSSVALLKPRRDVLEPTYLKHWLNSPATVAQMTSGMTGTAIKRLVLRQIRSAEIPLPPVNEQRRIARKLDLLLERIHACRERLDRVPQILKGFREAVLEAAVSGRLTKGWRKARGLAQPRKDVPLESVWQDASYGTAAKSHKTGKVPVLRMGNIQNGRLDWNHLVYTSDPAEITKYTLSSGDVLFNRTNSPELVGKTAVYRHERPAVYAGYLIRVRCGPLLVPDYLGFCLNSPAGRDYCWSVKTDGVSQSNINAQKLGKFTLPLPSIDEQTEIIRRVEELWALLDSLWHRYQAAASRVENVMPAVLAKAFRGELVPQDPEDEPADSLLERIRAQRSAPIEVKPRFTERVRTRGARRNS